MSSTASLPPPIYPQNGAGASPGKARAMAVKNIQALFSEALALHQQGKLPAAESLYRQVLLRERRHADALHLLGLVAHQAGKNDVAAGLIGAAIAINKGVVTYHANLAIVQKALGRWEEAIAAYRAAVDLDRGSADLRFNLGLLLAESGRYAEAVECYRAAIDIRSDSAALHAKLGIALNALKRPAEAILSYDRALSLQPGSFDVHYNRAGALWQVNDFDGAIAAYRAALALKPDLVEAHSRIGNILKQQGRIEEAEAAYRQALAIKPDFAEARSNLGLVLYARGHLDEAVAEYRAAIAANPGLCEAHINLGNVLKEREQYDAAVVCYQTALRIEPDHIEAQCNLGSAYMGQERLQEAMDQYHAVLARDPDFADAHFNLALALRLLGQLHEAVAAYDRAIASKPDFVLAHYYSSYPRLLLGDFTAGFQNYEWRWRGVGNFVKRVCDEPMLADHAVAGRTILLHAEQGLGDTIQFSRYASLVSAAGGRVILEVPRHLRRLFSGLQGVAAIVAPGESVPRFDAHCPLMSLPNIFSTTVATVPSAPAYLYAETEASQRWRARLGSQGFKIGIAWQGNPNSLAEKGRSAPLASFAPLAAIPGVRLISLQKTYGLDQLQSLPAGMHVETLGDDFDSGPDAFIDTAAVMMNLDLIVTVDTSIGHLAGALGRPTWIALQKIPHWVWLLDRHDTPWYPSVRLFRQTEHGDWAGPFAGMANEIKMKLEGQT